jgi:hypothetical protein
MVRKGSGKSRKKGESGFVGGRVILYLFALTNSRDSLYTVEWFYRQTKNQNLQSMGGKIDAGHPSATFQGMCCVGKGQSDKVAL